MSVNIQLPTLYAALESQVADTESRAKEFLKKIQSANPDEQKAVIEAVNHKFSLLDDFWQGLPIRENTANDVGLKSGTMMKGASTGVSPNVIEFMGLENWMNTLGIDTGWMRLFLMETVENATEAHILDWQNNMVHKQYDITAKIESQGFSQDSATRFGRKRYGGGSLADRSLLGTQSRYTLSNLLRAHQIAELKLKADAAYTAQAAVSTATTTYVTSIIETLNAAYVARITAMAGLGYQVTESTPMYFLCHFSHKAAVNAAFRTISGEDGTNILLEYPITPIFTANSNWPAQFGGKNAGMLITPAQKQIWVNFRAPRVGQTQIEASDALELIYQYYFNFQCFGDQCQISNLEA